MDLRQSSDNVDIGQITETAGKAISAVSGLASGIRNKAKAKKAQKISDAGGYFTLSGFQKSLIPVPDYAKVQAAASGNVAAGAGTGQPVINDSGQVDVAQVEAIPASEAQVKSKLKEYLPYILGVIVLVVVVFIVMKKKR